MAECHLEAVILGILLNIYLNLNRIMSKIVETNGNEIKISLQKSLFCTPEWFTARAIKNRMFLIFLDYKTGNV